MLIREEVDTTATPEQSWALIADPSIHGLWNPRIVDTQPASGGAAGIGYRYRVTYELSGRRSEFDAEITEFSAPSRFVARLEERQKGDGSHLERFMVESYTLTPRGSRTHVRHELKVHHPGINIFLRALVWLIMKLGKPTGKTFMENFAELAEGAPRPSAAGSPAATRTRATRA